MGKKDIKQIKKPQIQSKAQSNKFLNKNILLYLLIIVGITAAVYSNSLKNDFANWDDDEQIIKNTDIKSLSIESVKKIFTSYYVGMYQPLTTLTFATEYKFFELDPLPYHVDNLILHLLNVILVFFLIYKITKKTNISAIVALIFGIHPMHVESVAWVTERKDVLYSFFFLSGLLTYLNYINPSSGFKGNKNKFIIFTFIFFLLSLLSKSAAVCFPLVIILLDYYFKVKYKTKEIVVRALFFIISIIFGVVTIYSQQSSGAIADLTPTYSIFERIFLASYATSSYIFNLFLPANLCAMHYFPTKTGGLLPSDYYISIIVVIILILAVIFIKSEKYKKDIIFGLLFFIATIAMVLQIIPIGFAITAERYTYIPYIGLTFPIVKILASISESKKEKFYKLKPLFILILAVYTIAFSTLSYSRNKVWQNGIELFTNVIQKNPDSFHGYWIRGSAYSNKKDYKEAIADFDKALEKKAPNPAEILNNRGNAKNNINDYQGAFNDLNDAIKINPKLAEAYSNRGSARDNLNDFEGALKDYDKALSLKPSMITAYNNRGVTKGKMASQKRDINELKKDMAIAIDDFNTAIRINPYDPSAYLNRGNAKGVLKDFAGSIEDFNIAIKLGPTESQSYFNRGISKISIKDSIGACEDWKQAAKMGNEAANSLLNKFCNK